MKKNNKKYFPGAIGKKNLVPTAVPTGRKLQVTLRHFSEAPANSCEAAVSGKGLISLTNMLKQREALIAQLVEQLICNQ